jgi:hypothetical protein
MLDECARKMEGLNAFSGVCGKEKKQHAHNTTVISNSNLPKVE